MIGLDTTVLIDLFKNDERVISLLASIEETIFLNEIVYLELLIGLDPKNKMHNDEESFYENLFSSFPVLSLNVIAIKKAREVLWELKKEGKEIAPFDCTIAGIYLANGISTIITKNKNHFERIKGLQVLSY